MYAKLPTPLLVAPGSCTVRSQDGSRQPPATPPEPEPKERKRTETHVQTNGDKWAPQPHNQPVPPPARGGKWRGQDDTSFVPPHRREQR